MSNDTWTGARLGTDQDSPTGGSAMAQLVQQLGKWTCPGFVSTAARDAAFNGWVAAGNSPSDGMICTVGNVIYVRSGSSWRQQGGDTTLDQDHLEVETLIGTTSTWTDLVTVGGTSTGGICVAQVSVQAWNSDSGSDHTIDLQVLCDGNQIGVMGGISLIRAPSSTTPGAPFSRFLFWSSTPSPGAHAWRLQTRASAANAVFLETAALRVFEKAS